jgi:hypothetical protein
MASHGVRGARQPTDVVGDALVLRTHREGEVRIVGLHGPTSWTLVHHQVAANRFDGILESIDPFHHVEKLIWTLRPGEMNPKRLEATSQLPRNSAHLVLSPCARFVRLRHSSLSCDCVIATATPRPSIAILG